MSEKRRIPLDVVDSLFTWILLRPSSRFNGPRAR